MKKRNVIVAIGLVVIVGLAGWWWLESSTRPPETPPPPPVVTSPSQVTGHFTAVVVPEAGGGDSGANAGGAMQTLASSEIARPTTSDILAEPGDDYVKIAKKLSVLVTDAALPMPEREEALAHTLNLSAGNEAAVLMPLIKDPKLPDALTSTILDEALNRSLGFQADLYLAALAVHKSAELQTKIREHLAFLTGGDDKGADPAAWTDAVKAARKDWSE